MKSSLLVLLLFVFFAGCGGRADHETTDGTNTVTAVPNLNFTVGTVYKHDTTSYTEGFLFHDRKLFESSGATQENPLTRSIIGVVDWNKGKMDVKVELNKERYFGEGIAFFKDRLYQLTYKNQIGFIYDAATYKRVDSFRFQNAEGWALTTDSNSLIMSDGTSLLTWLDPVNCKPVRTLAVTENGMALDSLNELEYINGYIYANRYLKNYIVKINPKTGSVVGKLDLSSIAEAEHVRNPGGDVLNGIAYDRDTDKIYITGKLWSGIYQLNFPH
jgi:glutaminyl-peptide cyclotransferase